MLIQRRALLEMSGTPELSMFWRDPETGLSAAPDRTGGYVRAVYGRSETADDAAKFHFQRARHRYVTCSRRITLWSRAERRGARCIPVYRGRQNGMGRYPVRVIELHLASVEAGPQNTEDLRTVSECVESGSGQALNMTPLSDDIINQREKP